MALSRRLFLGGLLAAASAPAIITSKGFVPALDARPRPYQYPFFKFPEHGTVTGRFIQHEPAWHEFSQAEGRIYRPGERQIIKNQLFGARYGTQNAQELQRSLGKSRVVVLDYSELEARVIAQRDMRDMFNALKLNG